MGCFITLEGGEGTGKSTQAAKISAHLRKKGLGVVHTREPGGTPEAERLRDLLVHGEPDRWSPSAEALLNYAARDHHLRNVIRPALGRGDWVICDRFMDSTRVYQGYAGGCPESLIDALELAVVGETRPQLTLIFDLAPAAGLARASARVAAGEDRFERKDPGFHERLRDGYLAIAQREPGRCKIIESSGDAETVFQSVLRHLNAL